MLNPSVMVPEHEKMIGSRFCDLMDLDRNTPHRDVVDAHPPEVTRPSQEKVKDRILPARLSDWKLGKSPAGPK